MVKSVLLKLDRLCRNSERWKRPSKSLKTLEVAMMEKQVTVKAQAVLLVRLLE